MPNMMNRHNFYISSKIFSIILQNTFSTNRFWNKMLDSVLYKKVYANLITFVSNFLKKK